MNLAKNLRLVACLLLAALSGCIEDKSRQKLSDGPDRVPRDFGLHVVSALARNWGVTEQPDAKTVWAQLPLSHAVAVEAGPLTSSSPIHSDHRSNRSG